jgi:hypothetical protein
MFSQSQPFSAAPSYYGSYGTAFNWGYYRVADWGEAITRRRPDGFDAPAGIAAAPLPPNWLKEGYESAAVALEPTGNFQLQQHHADDAGWCSGEADQIVDRDWCWT